MSSGAPTMEERWDHWLRVLPFPLLALATVIALASASATGSASPEWRLVAQIVLVVVTATWIWWCTVAHPEWRDDRGRMVTYYVVRTALALVLTLLNPLFCIFAWIGFIDADDLFQGPRLWLALGITSFSMATGQSGGLPPRSDMQLLLLVLLLGVNFGLSLVMGRLGHSLWQSNQDRGAAITELERLNAELERASEENAALHRQLLEQARTSGAQEERQRLAREIHDGIAQSLAAILAQLQAARDGSDPQRRIDRATELARQTLVEARRSMMDLSPSPLAEGCLCDVLTSLVDRWGAEHDVRASAVVTGEPRPLHPEVETTVLRIAQETLTNVARHARATRVGLTLCYEEDEVILDVRDDGAGFEAGRPAPPTSFGLRGMRQRADRLAGQLTVETEPGAGTAVSLRLPALGRGAA